MRASHPRRHRPPERMPRCPRCRPSASPSCSLAAAVGFVALGVSLAQVPGAADSARAELESAKVALEAGDTDAATDAVDRAREHADTVQVGVQGPAGLVGQWLPVVGTSVRDARHLGDALDAVVSVAELGAEAYPEITGDDATFFEAGHVDIPTLERLVATAGDAEDELARAQHQPDGHRGNRAGGARLGDARDAGARAGRPAARRPERPDAADAPAAGHPGRRGRAQVPPGDPQPRRAALLRRHGPLLRPRHRLGRPGDDRRDRGHRRQPGDVPAALLAQGEGQPLPPRAHRASCWRGMAPSWPVAGEETLNAWRSLRGRNMSGLVAVDVVALARLAEITGPMDVPGYGRVDSTQPRRDPDRQLRRLRRSRHRGTQGSANRALVAALRGPAAGHRPAPRQGPGAGRGRRRDATSPPTSATTEVQGTLDDLAISGDLSHTEHDYLGVFTQNAVPSKTDYWQSRAVRSDVRLRPDGSARVALEVEIHNDSAPYAGPGADPQQGYFTRWATLSVGSFLPRGAAVDAGDRGRGAGRLHRRRLLRPPVRPAHDRARRRRSGAPCAWSTTSRPPPSATATP